MWTADVERELSAIHVSRFVLERENGRWVARAFLRSPDESESFYAHVEGHGIGDVFRGMVQLGSERTKASKP